VEYADAVRNAFVLELVKQACSSPNRVLRLELIADPHGPIRARIDIAITQEQLDAAARAQLGREIAG
jgi:hypothetical protein